MLQTEVDKLIAYADELLEAAQRETTRSQEDVVTHLICNNARQSIISYFTCFLIQEKIPVVHPVTMQGLLDQCKDVDARFESIDLTPVHCRCETHDNDYCLDFEQVEQCMQIAQHARSIVKKNPPGY